MPVLSRMSRLIRVDKIATKEAMSFNREGKCPFLSKGWPDVRERHAPIAPMSKDPFGLRLQTRKTRRVAKLSTRYYQEKDASRPNVVVRW